MAATVLTEAERLFLEELNRRGVRFLIVGASAAVLQGATTATQDVDLWFETLTNRQIAEAARAAGGLWIPGGVGLRPPQIGGEALGDRFDVVVYMHGMRAFDEEYAESMAMTIDGIPVRVLPLPRIIESKRAAGRKRDLAQIPALEEALAAISSRKK